MVGWVGGLCLIELVKLIVHYNFAGCGIRLARAGYAVFGIDYEGHGRSRGARCYIKKFENIVNDCNEFFKSICGMHQYIPVLINLSLSIPLNFS